MAGERDEPLGDNDNNATTGGEPQKRSDARVDAGGGMSGQPIGGNDSATGSGTTLTQGAEFNARDEEFILRKSKSSGDQPQRESASSAKATGGTDFADQGRGATEEGEAEDEPGAGPADVGSGGPGSSV